MELEYQGGVMPINFPMQISPNRYNLRAQPWEILQALERFKVSQNVVSLGFGYRNLYGY